MFLFVALLDDFHALSNGNELIALEQTAAEWAVEAAAPTGFGVFTHAIVTKDMMTPRQYCGSLFIKWSKANTAILSQLLARMLQNL
jgi:hypothetical protein